MLQDDASWTLPRQMGVEYSEIKHSFQVKSKKLDEIPLRSTAIPSSRYLAFDTRANASYAVAAALLEAQNDVLRATEAVKASGVTLPAGSFLVESTASSDTHFLKITKARYARVQVLRHVTGSLCSMHRVRSTPTIVERSRCCWSISAPSLSRSPAACGSPS